ncbi:MAG: OmpH family outer membrane protein [Alistipes sp.]|nr:OmpH family outer membrane protein [Candidatus Alistipes equi]
MKKLFFVTFFLALVTTLSAQRTMVVNSEKIFNSLPEYTKGIAEIESASQTYRTKIEEMYKGVAQMHSLYQTTSSKMDESSRMEYEKQIQQKESLIQQYQESVFGKDGVIAVKRKELIEPIQKKVFSAISTLAKSQGYDIVLDCSSNPIVLYCKEECDKSDEIINILKK